MRLPLGFSDLLQDEAFLIILFREWAKSTGNCAYLEETYRKKLSGDPFGNVLAIILDSFSTVRESEWGVGDLLSFDEESILTEVAIQIRSKFNDNSVQNHPILPNIRTAAEIPRTGRDILISKLNASNWQFTFSPI